jgi:hypothetical protein
MKLSFSTLIAISLFILLSSISFADDLGIGIDLYSGTMEVCDNSNLDLILDIDVTKLTISNGERSYQFKTKKIKTNSNPFTVTLDKKDIDALYLVLDKRGNTAKNGLNYSGTFAPGWNGKTSKVCTGWIDMINDAPSIKGVTYDYNTKLIYIDTQNVRMKTSTVPELNPSKIIITDMDTLFVQLSATTAKLGTGVNASNSTERMCVTLSKKEIAALDSKIKSNTVLKIILLDGWSTINSLGMSDIDKRMSLSVTGYSTPVVELGNKSLDVTLLEGNMTVGGSISASIDRSGLIYLVPEDKISLSVLELDEMVASNTAVKVCALKAGSVTIPTAKLLMNVPHEIYCLLGVSNSGESPIILGEIMVELPKVLILNKVLPSTALATLKKVALGEYSIIRGGTLNTDFVLNGGSKVYNTEMYFCVLSVPISPLPRQKSKGSEYGMMIVDSSSIFVDPGDSIYVFEVDSSGYLIKYKKLK